MMGGYSNIYDNILSWMTLTLCLDTKCRASLSINATIHQYRFLVCTYSSISGGIERFKAPGKPQIGYINPRYLQFICKLSSSLLKKMKIIFQYMSMGILRSSSRRVLGHKVPSKRHLQKTNRN